MNIIEQLTPTQFEWLQTLLSGVSLLMLAIVFVALLSKR